MATVRQSGGDYGSLNAALAAAEVSIQIDQSWSVPDTTPCIFTTAGTTVTVSGSAKHPGYISGGNYYRAEINATDAFDVNAANVTIDGLVLKLTSTATSAEAVDFQGGDNLTLKNCLIYANDTRYNNQDGVYCANQNLTVTVEQCKIWNFSRGGIMYQNYSGQVTGTVNCNAVTIFNCGRSGEINAYSGGVVAERSSVDTRITLNVQNALIVGCDADDGANDYRQETATQVIWNISNSIDSDGSISTVLDTGTGNLGSRTETDSDTPGAGNWVVFEDITAYPYDLRLKDNAENDAQDAHTTATAHSLTIPSTDIVGTSRPQNTSYDIGAFEIVSGAPAAALTPPRIHPIRFLGVR